MKRGRERGSKEAVSSSESDLSADEYLDGVGEHDHTGIQEPGYVSWLVVHTVAVEEVT